MKIQLGKKEADYDADVEGATRVLLHRFGLEPRKKDGLAKMHSLVLELYERKKQANREKKPFSRYGYVRFRSPSTHE